MERIIISNTSPLIALSYLGLLELPRNLWQRLYVPYAVLREVTKKSPGREEVEKAVREGWIVVREVKEKAIVQILSSPAPTL